MRLELEFEDDFAGTALDRGRWVPHYLPQWRSRARSAARYTVARGSLSLRIDADQEPWCPEWDGATRVSSIQTGVFAGPPGSTVGQHRFHRDAVVHEAQETQRLYTPRFGRVELLARFSDDPDVMGALWLIGFEDEPERSGELCVCEIFGRDVAHDHVRAGMGIHPFADPRLDDDFEQVRLALDVREPHEYAADWAPGRARFFVDGALVKESAQAPDYPLQLMLGLYEFRGEQVAGRYPKELVVERVRGYRRGA